jgi:hypothetical protein
MRHKDSRYYSRRIIILQQVNRLISIYFKKYIRLYHYQDKVPDPQSSTKRVTWVEYDWPNYDYNSI